MSKAIAMATVMLAKLCLVHISEIPPILSPKSVYHTGKTMRNLEDLKLDLNLEKRRGLRKGDIIHRVLLKKKWNDFLSYI